MGASHARILLEKSNIFSVTLQNHSIVVDSDSRLRTFKIIGHIVEDKIRVIIDRGCTKVVMGTGQWDAGWPNEEPTLFSKYEEQLEIVISMMVEMFRGTNVDLYFRSTQCVFVLFLHLYVIIVVSYRAVPHSYQSAFNTVLNHIICSPCYFYFYCSYNPISDTISSCPPKDWRNPPVIDMYNQVTKRVCNKFKIPLIETNDIIGIMWDRAGDWSHYYDVSSDVEVLHILDRIFVQG